MIAAKTTESLRQQFDQTAIPETANLLRSGVKDINAVAMDLRTGARTIARVLNETTVEANGFLTRVQNGCINGAERVADSAERMVRILNALFGGLMFLACGVGIVFGLALGMFLHDWWATPTRPVQPAIVQPQTPAVASVPEGRPKAASHRKYLNNLELKHALKIREEGRLQGLRAFLHGVWKTARTEETFDNSNSVLPAEELSERIRQAEVEWKQIDADLIKILGTEAKVAVLAAGPLIASWPCLFSGCGCSHRSRGRIGWFAPEAPTIS